MSSPGLISLCSSIHQPLEVLLTVVLLGNKEDSLYDKLEKEALRGLYFAQIQWFENTKIKLITNFNKDLFQTDWADAVHQKSWLVPRPPLSRTTFDSNPETRPLKGILA